jgi:putative hydrolase of the HAD superfamily
MVRAVTFDLWQTLLLDRPENLRAARDARIRGIAALLTTGGGSIPPARVADAYEAVGPRLEAAWRTLRDVGARGQVRWMLEMLGVSGDIPEDGARMDALEAAYCEPILSFMPQANAGAREVLASLSERGFRLGLICNTGRTPGTMLRRVLERLALLPYLSVLTFSDEVGLRKPHPDIFRRTLDALGAAPAEAVHIGDDVATDMAGARGVGMRAVHLCHAASATPAPDPTASVPTLAAFRDLLIHADPAGPACRRHTSVR